MAAPLRLDPEASSLLKEAAALLPAPAYLVGGAVRDALLGRPSFDLDLAVFDARPAAERLAGAFKATLVPLDEDNGVYRLVLPGKHKTIRQIDVARIQGKTIEEDLARRDFTVNALALPLAGAADKAAIIDPRGGLADLSKKQLRAESESLFKDDPLRLLRAFRIAAQLGFSIEKNTLTLITRQRQGVRKPAGERLRSELMALLEQPGCAKWLRLMDEAELLTCLFEELEPSRQCALVYYGPGGVLTHVLDTAERADFLMHNLHKVFPRHAARLEAHLAGRSSEGNPYKAVLILAALLHDVSKPETARQVDGRLRFFGHDTKGAKRAEAILKRLRFSSDHVAAVSCVVANHLRPGNLAGGPAITDKAVYRFFRDLGEDAVSLLLVCWADHASYLKEEQVLRLLPIAVDPSAGISKVRPADARKTIHHLQTIALLLDRCFDEEKKAVPDAVIDGRDVMKLLGIGPGPQVGELLDRVREAQAEGRISDRAQALEFLLKEARPA